MLHNMADKLAADVCVFTFCNCEFQHLHYMEIRVLEIGSGKSIFGGLNTTRIHLLF